MAGSVSYRTSLRILSRIQGMTRFADFAALGRRLERARGRLEKRDEVARFLRTLAPDEIATAVAFLAARAFPASDPRVLGVRGLPAERPGEAEALGPLTLLHVAEAFADVAAAAGSGVRRARDERLARLASRASDDERDFLARIVGGEMRTGVSEGLLLEAIAAAWGVDVATTRRAALFLGDLTAVAVLAATGGAAAVAGASPRPFVPLLPMLAEIRRLSLRAGRARRPHRARVQVRRRAHPAAPGGGSRAGLDAAPVRRHAQPPGRGRDHAARSLRRAIHPRRRGGRPRRRRAAAALPGADAALPPRARRRSARARDAAGPALLRLPHGRRTLADRRALRAALGGAHRGDRRPLPRRAAHRHRRGGGRHVPRRRARRRPRGRDGEGPRQHLRARRPRQALVQAQGGRDGGLRDRRRRPRLGPPPGLALQLSPRRARR